VYTVTACAARDDVAEVVGIAEVIAVGSEPQEINNKAIITAKAAIARILIRTAILKRHYGAYTKCYQNQGRIIIPRHFLKHRPDVVNVRQGYFRFSTLSGLFIVSFQWYKGPGPVRGKDTTGARTVALLFQGIF
jgi:hypothetical protein